MNFVKRVYSVSMGFLLLCQSVVISADNMTERALFEYLLDKNRYDFTVRPHAVTGNSTRIEVDLVLNSIGPVNDMDMELSASFYLRQQWQDPRLAHNAFNRSLVVSHSFIEKMWVPDTFFPQAKSEYRHLLTTPNVLMRLQPDGSLLYSQRLSVTLQCKMDLHKFPLDEQSCAIQMESYSYVVADVYFIWSLERGSLNVLENAFIPDFSIIGSSSEDCTAKYATGTFTCLKASIELKREIGFYITQTYVPSILIVILSWASFWIDHDAVPARISVGLLTVLTITTQSSGARSQLPRVPYIKSIDVWMAVCLVFVFGAYMEYAVVTVLSRRHRKTIARSNTVVKLCEIVMKENGIGNSNGVPNGGTDRQFSSDKSKDTDTTSNSERTNAGRVVDKRSRYIFPVAFFIFNLCYWIFYIYGPKK